MKKGIGEALGDVKLGKKKFPVIIILIVGVGGAALLLGRKKAGDSTVDTSTIEDKILADVNGVLTAQSQSNDAKFGGILDAINSGFGSIVKLLPPAIGGGSSAGTTVTLPPSSTPVSSPLPPPPIVKYDVLNAYLTEAKAGYQVAPLTPSAYYGPTDTHTPVAGLSPTVKVPQPANFYVAPPPSQVWFSPDGVAGHESLMAQSQLPSNAFVNGSKQLGDGAVIDVYSVQQQSISGKPAYSAVDYWTSKGVTFG